MSVTLDNHDPRYRDRAADSVFGRHTLTDGPSCAARMPIQRAVTPDIDGAERTDTVARGSSTGVIDVAGQLLGGG